MFCFAVWAGDGSSLTYRSAWVVFKGPNNKKDQTAKKKKKKFRPKGQKNKRSLWHRLQPLPLKAWERDVRAIK